MFIFLSYGHDQFKHFAVRLKKDLESYHHEVWFDETQLHGGVDWEHYIEKGLRKAMHEKGKLIILMTQHSMREPDGFCLNEIAYAESNRTPIISIRVESFTPPEKFSQYIDLVAYTQGEGDEMGYEEQLKKILQAIEK